MKIKDLQARQSNVEVEGAVLEVGEPREFTKFNKTGRVANAILKDESGQVKLTLWNEQIDQIKVGDRVKIQKGYVGEWQGELQLTTGKFGTLEVLGGDSAEPAIKKPSEPISEEEVTEDEKEEAEVLTGLKEEPAGEAVTEDEKVEAKPDSSEHAGLDVEEEEIK